MILSGVTVINTRDGSLAHDMDIVADGGEIRQIAPSGTLDRANGALDVRGKFVVPGFIDAHAHPLNADPQDPLMLMLANGVTGFRQLSGTPQMLRARRDRTLMPDGPAPELLEMAGEILTGANAGSVEAALEEIRKEKEQGADFIKVIEVSPEVFFAALRESTRLGLPFLGHLPPNVDVAEAARAGMRSIEHLGPRDAILLGCSTDETAIRRGVAELPPRGPRIGGPLPMDVILRALAAPTMTTSPTDFARLERVVETFSIDRAHRLADLFAASGTWQVPTLIRIRTMSFVNDETYQSDPNLAYAPLPMRQMWRALADEFSQRFSAAQRATLARIYELQLGLVRVFKDHGVNMLTGDDSGSAAAWCLPGFGLHREFDLLAEAGLKPLEVLQMATLNAARFLGREVSMGTVEIGKEANLVLLDADPTESVQHLHRVVGVVRNGKYLSGQDLERLKEEVATRVAGTAGPNPGVTQSCC